MHTWGNLCWILASTLALLSSITSQAYGEWNVSFINSLWLGVKGIPDQATVIADKIDKWKEERYGESKTPQGDDARFNGCINSPHPSNGSFSLMQFSQVQNVSSLTRGQLEAIAGVPWCYTSTGMRWISDYDPNIYLDVSVGDDGRAIASLKNIGVK